MLHYFLIYFSGIQGVKELGRKVNSLYYKELQTSTWLVLKMSGNLFWFFPFNQMENAVNNILFDQLLFHTCNFTNIAFRILLFSSLAYNIKLKKSYFVKTRPKSVKFKFHTKPNNRVYKISSLAFLNCTVEIFRFP